MKDVVIVGGGLAGLALANELADKCSVTLIEKERYPFHKVCGEYISNESRTYLASLGVPFETWNLPEMKRLLISSPKGKTLRQELDLGGFGVSRYKLDHFLMERARERGVEVLDGTTVLEVKEVEHAGEHIQEVQTANEGILAKLVIGAYGKRSKLDKQFDRPFMEKRTPYFAVKYHIRLDEVPDDEIALHNFEGGYCGMSRVEEDRVCLCYLGSTSVLKKSGSIAAMEKEVLFQNPYLRKIFSHAEFLYDQPLVIAQISFDKKEQVYQGIPMIGDAAGLITPLCGNGMSMALHGAHLLAPLIDAYLTKDLNRDQFHQQFQTLWQSNFASRLKAGRVFQGFFGAGWMTELFLSGLQPFDGIQKKLIALTHGRDFTR